MTRDSWHFNRSGRGAVVTLRAAGRVALALATVVATAGLGVGPVVAQDYERAPVRWSESEPQDDVAALQQRLADGDLVLASNGRELLDQLLEEFDIPASSQVLVYSKTSLQRRHISPRTPRAMYFNDRIYLGWVPGGAVELATMDPQLGTVFYLVEERPPPPPPRDGSDHDRPDDRLGPEPQFIRDRDCLSCHGGMFVRGIPGLFVRSVFTTPGGEPLLRHGTEIVDHRTPFSLRWGGWYVTGVHGDELHRGNVFAADTEGGLVVNLEEGANLTDLDGLVDLSGYPATTSDIVALMVLEHQMAMHNALTRAQLRARHMLHYQAGLQRELGEEVTEGPEYESVVRVFDGLVEEVVDALLFKDEAPMPDGGVSGDPRFVEDYQAGARLDRRGRSLREFDLRTRMMKHRCSPLIDSELFAALPDSLKQRIYARLAEALDLDRPHPRYRHLGAAERLRIAAILRDTHEGLPEGWMAAVDEDDGEGDF